MSLPEKRDARTETPRPSYWHPERVRDPLIPVARPRLPGSDAITPYLHRIEKSGWYSNGGPLVTELEERLAEHAGGGPARVATVANATIGLTLALLAHDLPTGALCLVPAWTFAATAHAILLAGLIPWIVDVDPDTWALEPSAARALLPAAPGPVAAVLPVGPFGAPIEPEGWLAFRDATGVAVILDAAAGFDTIRASALPAVVSLHATKVLGVGEGGFICSTDPSFIQEIQQRANFGFWNTREATTRALNGKISEYTAAVGLAALDQWLEARADFSRVAKVYREQLRRDDALRLQPGLGEEWVSSTIVLQSRKQPADTLDEILATARVGTRHWWGGGLQRHSAFAAFPRSDTTESDRLADQSLGLPCWRGLAESQIIVICDLLVAASPEPCGASAQAEKA